MREAEETQHRLYEQSPLREITGETIRPGGFVLTDRAMAFCRFPTRSRILDVGCGAAATVERLRATYGMDAFGVDLSAALLDEGRRRNPNLVLVRASAEALPCQNAELDGIICECVLSIVADSERALREFHRLLGDRGRLIVTDVYARCPEKNERIHDLPRISCLTGALPEKEIRERFQSNGFRIALWEDHSIVLRELAARLILRYGCMDAFWNLNCSKEASETMTTAIASMKPGYYLLVAEKEIS